jgi:glucosamine kinase
MFLLAESGSTKTQWRLFDGDKIHASESLGINPFFADKVFVFSELDKTNLKDYSGKIDKIIFYGAGCSSEERNEFLKQIFQAYFPSCLDIIVDHDMMAACMALFGDGNGIACIIGTGSNSCVYEQGKITQNVPALGYILGDEASGADIGKEILKHYIYKTLPDDIYLYIKNTLKLDKEDVFEAVYKQPLPNRYLASFSVIASEFRQTEFIQTILKRGFDAFTKYHIACYPEARDYPIAAVGSIAEVFQAEFEEVLHSYNLKLTKVDKAPIDALVTYYSKQKSHS